MASRNTAVIGAAANWSLEAWVWPRTLHQSGIVAYNGVDDTGQGGFGFGIGNSSGGSGSDLVIHGTENSFQVLHNGDWVDISHRSLANFIRGSPGYEGESIRLLTCSAGACEEGAAQNLANKLGVGVLAPSDLLYVYRTGSLQIANNGIWNLFMPWGS